MLAQAIARIPDAVEALRAYEDRRRARAGMLVRSSRRLNRVEQAQNPVACAARNLGLRYAPARSLTRHTTRPMRSTSGGRGARLGSSNVTPARPKSVRHRCVERIGEPPPSTSANSAIGCSRVCAPSRAPRNSPRCAVGQGRSHPGVTRCHGRGPLPGPADSSSGDVATPASGPLVNNAGIAIGAPLECVPIDLITRPTGDKYHRHIAVYAAPASVTAHILEAESSTSVPGSSTSHYRIWERTRPPSSPRRG